MSGIGKLFHIFLHNLGQFSARGWAIGKFFAENKTIWGFWPLGGTPLATMQDVAGYLVIWRQIMAVEMLFTCVCGAQKKTSNHWVLAKATANGITFMPWDWNLAMSSDIIILCGEGCAASLLSRSLGEWKRVVKPAEVAETELAVA
jgi:hypothetical protein